MTTAAPSLAAIVTREIERCSREEHVLARRRALLTDASRRLAMGYSAAVVEVELREKGIELGPVAQQPGLVNILALDLATLVRTGQRPAPVALAALREAGL